MKVAILGRGHVGRTLGSRLASAGHDIRFGVRAPGEPDELSLTEAVAWGETVILAISASAIDEGFMGQFDWTGRLLIDCTNPIRADFSGLDWQGESSWGERVARLAPEARVAKAFNSVSAELMAEPELPSGRAAMMFAAAPENVEAVDALVADVGFEPLHVGGLDMCRHLESACWLYISLAHRHGRSFGFRMDRR